MAEGKGFVNIELFIEPSDEITDEELDLRTRYLITEIQGLNVESTSLLTNKKLPKGAKSGDPVTLGALLVVVLPAVIPTVMELLYDWIRRTQEDVIKIKVQQGDQAIEVEYPRNMSQSELTKQINLVKQFLNRSTKS